MNKTEIFAACRLSKQFFAENYYKIPVVDGGPQLFEMRYYQTEISNMIETESLIIGLKARQIGWTTIGVFNALYDVLFNEEHPWLFVSRTEDAAQKMLNKAVYAYKRFPKWMKDALPKVEHETQNALVFDNGSRIESVPATGSTGRGDSVYGALLDECGFMEYAEDIWGAVEPLVYGPAMLFSTANGMGNFFHEIWLDSQRDDSVWKGIFFPWHVVKTRDDAWYNHTKMSFRGREWLFFQEYPSTPEEAFAKSGRVAFTLESIKTCYEEINPVARYAWTIGVDEAILLEDGANADIEINVWKAPDVQRDDHRRPIFRPNYVVGCDVAEGLEHGDFTYITVIDANTREQVLSCKSAVPISYLDGLLNWIGKYYMNALMVVEHNNAGILPLDRLNRDRWYPRLYRQDFYAQVGGAARTPRYGWGTDKGSKPKMIHDFVYALTEQGIILHDPEFIIEAQTFVADGRGSYGATRNNHDDVIMGTLIAWQGVLDSPNYPIIWDDPENLPVSHDDFDAFAFNSDIESAAQLLDAPLGQTRPEKIKKTLIFTDENLGI